MHKITYASISKTGKRQKNEDSFKIIDAPNANRWMGIIADGMGGHTKGNVASKVVVDAISKYWERNGQLPDSEEKVKKARVKASVAIDNAAIENGFAQMGTTMVMASIEGEKVTIAHIGDSRCYLIRRGHYDYDDINNTEKDHVVYQTKDHVRKDCGWEMISRSFFSFKPEKAIPEIAQFDLQPGDRIFLCSDGVYKCIVPQVLKDHLFENKTPEQILETIDSLCEQSSDDNYTAIMVRID